MQSTALLGLNLPPASLAILILGVFAIALVELAWIIVLESRLRRFMKGGNGASLEETIRGIIARHEQFELFRKEVGHALAIIDKRVRSAPRGVGTVRFDAFQGDGSGGMQSFATALVSENGDGVVISSLHARASTRIFAKPVRRFQSDHELTEEERRAIDDARAGMALS